VVLKFTQIPSFQSCTLLEFPQYACKVLGRSVSWFWSYGADTHKLIILDIHDFQKSSDIESFILFTDNSNIFSSHQDPHILPNTAFGELKLVHDWIRANNVLLIWTQLTTCGLAIQ